MSYIDRLNGYQDEMIERLKGVLAIPSVAGEPEGDAPFGKAVQEAYDYVMDMARKDGFETFDADGYGGHIAWGEGPATMGILGHLDVVPAGEGWDYPAFAGTVADGRLYGRGAKDDKGPVFTAYYAMKALREEGIVPKRQVRLILGLNEEKSWSGMYHYLEKAGAPDFSITPDADYPVINGEMGLLIFDIAGKFGKGLRDGLQLKSVTGGNAPNSVADWAKASVGCDSSAPIKELAAAYAKETGHTVKVTGRNKGAEISTEGVAAHGSTPWLGKNAISILMDFLGRLHFANEEHNAFVEFYNKYLGFELDGASLGVGFEDEVSGKLVLNVGQIFMDKDAMRIVVNIRYPISCSDEKVYEGMMPALNEYDYGLVKMEHKGPIYTPADSPLVRKLMEAYQRNTGDMESKPFVMGGGTYARAVPNGVAFGIGFPGEPEVIHQKNEYFEIEAMMRSARIYADAIYMLAAEE